MNLRGRTTSVTVSLGIAYITDMSTPPFNTFGVVLSYPYKKVLPCIKANNVYEVGIVYYDEMLRQTAVNVIRRDVYINGPWFPSSFLDVQLWGAGVSTNMPSIPGIPNNSKGDKPSIDVTIGTFPSWAKFYSIVITEPYDDFRYLGVEIDTGRVNGYAVRKITGTFSVEVGDFFRYPLLGSGVGFGQGKSYIVDKVDPTGEYFNIVVGEEAIVTVTEITCEVYKIARKKNIYHEVYFNTIPIVPSIVKIDKYSAYYIYDKKITSAVARDRYIETPSANNTFQNEFWPIKGRVQIYLEESSKKTTIGTLMRWSGPVVNNTLVNNLNVFDSGNYNNELNARFGDITGLRQVGYTLKILQWSNINTAFLGRRKLQNADGSTQLVVTDSLIGTIDPSTQEYGTKYPSSVVLANSNLFFFDAIKGVYCMDTENEVITISDALAARFWLDIATLVKGDNRYEVISGYDFMYDDLYVTIKLTDEISSITIYFNINDKRWKSFVEMYGSDETPIDWYGAVGQTFVTFLKGQVWEQNALTEAGAPVYSKLFGVQRKFINEFVTNVDKSKVKVFLTHDMHVNTLPEIVKFQTPKNDMYPNGMYSELLPANYKYKEGVYYAGLKNDANTKGIPVDEPAKRLQIATGRPLRGHCLSVKIEFFTPKYVVLMSSGVGQIISDKS